MSDLLYDTFKEYSRIQEEMVLTEQGLYCKGKVPDGYGGPEISLWVVHTVHMVNSAGNIQTLEFHNPDPKNKNGSTSPGTVTIDGLAPVYPANGYGKIGTGDARLWVTRMSPDLPTGIRVRGKISMDIRDAAV